MASLPRTPTAARRADMSAWRAAAVAQPGRGQLFRAQPCRRQTRRRRAACPGLERHWIFMACSGAVSGARYLPRTVATPGDQSPLKLAAKCRDARVPYTFPFSDFLATQKK